MKMRIIQVSCFILSYCSFQLSAQMKMNFNKDVNESSFQMIDTIKGYKYKAVESNYKIVTVNLKRSYSDAYLANEYLAKFKMTTIKSFSDEEQNRTIEVLICPLDSINKTLIDIKKSCDELKLDYDYYETWKYGCCVMPTDVNLYDYTNNLIISGSEKIYTGSFPHSNLKLYFSYKAPQNDSTSLGCINISFNEKEQYHVFLKGKVKKVWEEGGWLDNCPALYPNIDIELAKKVSYDKDETTYNFFSMSNIKSITDINFSMKFKFECDESILPINIPIINGKPFGKNEENQIYEVKHM